MSAPFTPEQIHRLYRSYRITYPQDARDRLWRTKHACRYCGKRIPKRKYATLEHVLPTSKGGSDSPEKLTVQRALIELTAGHQFGPPKSKKSRRNISLPAMAVASLAEHRTKMLANGCAAKDHLVFCDSAGGPIRKSNFARRSYKPLLAAASVPVVRFHDLRHTSATRMLADGVHAKLVQERLGHSQISLTSDTYSHVLPEMDRRAGETFDRVFKRNA